MLLLQEKIKSEWIPEFSLVLFSFQKPTYKNLETITHRILVDTKTLFWYIYIVLKIQRGGRIMTARKPLTKGQIVSTLAKKFGISKKTTGEILDEIVALAVSETKKAGSFTLPGVGKVVLSKRKARKGRNPATGEEIKIPAKTVVKMRMAKAFKEAIIPPKK
jgi:DNA-binding protein HU-beta